MYTYKELEIATTNFSEEKKIGSGRYGDMYKGLLSDGTVAAIKKLHMLNHSGSNQKHEERSFRLEVSHLLSFFVIYFIRCLFMLSMLSTNTIYNIYINILNKLLSRWNNFKAVKLWHVSLLRLGDSRVTVSRIHVQLSVTIKYFSKYQMGNSLMVIQYDLFVYSLRSIFLEWMFIF